MDPAQPWVPLEQLDIDPRVVYMASVALCERAYGKPREYDAERVIKEDVRDLSDAELMEIASSPGTAEETGGEGERREVH